MEDDKLYNVRVNQWMTVGFEGETRNEGDEFIMTGEQIAKMQGTRKSNLFVTVLGPVEDNPETEE